MNEMRMKLKQKLDMCGYIYFDRKYSIVVEFTDKTVFYNIYDDRYVVHIVDIKGEIIASKEYKRPSDAIKFTLGF